MARYVVLDWDYQQLRVLSATVKHGQVHVHQALCWDEGQSPNLAEAEALGRRLRERLRAAGIAAAPVLACVGRDRVIVKEVRYPAVPANEEPAVIRFQVIKELTDQPDEMVIDYTPVTEAGSSAERRVLALIVRRELLTAYQVLCRAAGLKLQALTPRAFGTLACLRYVPHDSAVPAPGGASESAVAVLSVGKPWAEFCVVHRDKLLLTRSLSVGPALVGEVRRNLIIHDGQVSRHPVAAVFVAGGEADNTFDKLRELMGVPVQVLDPFACLPRGSTVQHAPTAGRGGYVGALGLLDVLAERRALPINFARPKEPRPVRDPRQRRLVLAAAAAVALLVGAGAFCYAQLAARDREINKLFLEKTDLDQQLSRADEDDRRLRTLDDWAAKDVVWLDEFYDLTQRFPDLNSIRLVNIAGQPLDRKDRHIARMTLTGMTTNSPTAVDQFFAGLAQDAHYRPGPNSPGRNNGADFFRFPQLFSAHVDLERLPPDQFTRRLPDGKAGDKQEGEDGGIMDMGFGGFGGGAP